MKYKPVDFPVEAAEQITKQGGKPIMAGVWKRRQHVSFMLVSDDPSGKNNAMERHVSVSSSTEGKVRQPTRNELIEAATQAGLDWGRCDLSQGKECVHIYQVGD